MSKKSSETVAAADSKGLEVKNVPTGYTVDENGVVDATTGTMKRLTRQPVWVEAISRLEDNSGHRYHLAGVARNGRRFELDLGASDAGSPRKLAAALRDHGVVIFEKAQEKLAAYLDAWELPDSLRVEHTGWCEFRGHLAFAMPNQVVASPEIDGLVRYSPGEGSEAVRTARSSGTLKEWQEGPAALTRGNPIPMFATMVAFVGPLLRRVPGAEFGGAHLHAPSSQGKTTTVQSAAAVWGDGSDPRFSQTAYSQRWLTSRCGGEGLAAEHSDMLVVLDEMGQAEPRDVLDLVFDISGGSGKRTFTRDRDPRRVRKWMTPLLSTGEDGVADFDRKEGIVPKGGQMVRFLQIESPGAVFTETHGREPREFVEEFKEACSRCYGTAGPAFVRGLLKWLEEDAPGFRRKELGEWLDAIVDGHLAELPEPPDPLRSRAIRMLSTVQLAGEIASQLEVLPYEESEIGEAVRQVRDLWLAQNRAVTDSERGARRLVRELSRNLHRLRRVRNGQAGNPPRDPAGYLVEGRTGPVVFRDAIMLEPAVFAEWVGHGQGIRTAVLSFLAAESMVRVTEESGKKRYSHRWPKVPVRRDANRRFIHLSLDVLSLFEEESEPEAA